MPDELPRRRDELPSRREEPSEPRDLPLVPEYDVRNCIVCGQPMEGRKCKLVCRQCGVMIDCSDAY